MKKDISCIFCGKNVGDTDDHVPPQCLFPRPLPSNMITVPACHDCNNKRFSKDDEVVRNILSSLEIHERHTDIKNHLAPKRNRSFTKKYYGEKKLQALLDKMKPVAQYDNFGNYIGKKAAISLDDPIFDKFIERVSRGLLFHVNQIGYFEGNFRWKLSPSQKDIESMPQEMKDFLFSGKPKSIGNTFSYIGYCIPHYVGSMWILNFYQGIEIMSIVTPKA